MYREIEAFLILQILFYLQVENLHCGYLELTAALCKRLRDHRAIIELSAISIANHVQTDRLISCKDTF